MIEDAPRPIEGRLAFVGELTGSVSSRVLELLLALVMVMVVTPLV